MTLLQFWGIIHLVQFRGGEKMTFETVLFIVEASSSVVALGFIFYCGYQVVKLLKLLQEHTVLEIQKLNGSD